MTDAAARVSRSSQSPLKVYSCQTPLWRSDDNRMAATTTRRKRIIMPAVDEQDDDNRVPSPPVREEGPLGSSEKEKGSEAVAVNSTRRRTSFLFFGCFLLLCCLLMIFVSSSSSGIYQRLGLSKLFMLKIITLLPVALSLAIGAWPNSKRPLRGRILPLTLAAATVLGQLPAFLGAATAATGIVIFSLATLSLSQEQARLLVHSGGKEENGSSHHGDNTNNNNRDESSNQQRQQQNHQKETLRVLGSTMLLVAVLLTENFMVWVVSATFVPGQLSETAPLPLQDNGRLILKNLVFSGLTQLQVVGGLRRLWNVQWGLVACLGSSFFILEIFPSSSPQGGVGGGHRPLYNKSTRAVLTLAAARTIRTISFLLTVVPSQSKSCYANHYPYPPPTDVWEWIWVGLQPASHGGCNDLIISGHATVTSTLACISVSVANDPLFTFSLWSMVFLDYTVEIYEGFHYSVDMWLGMILVSLLWRVLQSIEEVNVSTTTTTRNLPRNNNSTEPTLARLFMKDIDGQTVVLYTIPALIVYLQLTIFPEAAVNFLIVAYCITVGVLYLGFARRQKDAAKHAACQNHAQHVLICLLFMALGVYL